MDSKNFQNVFIIENWEPTRAPHKDGFNSFIINLASPTIILLKENSFSSVSLNDNRKYSKRADRPPVYFPVKLIQTNQ